ncbi:TRAP transporter small permease [Desulfocurvus sp. DL9XJH121]
MRPSASICLKVSDALERLCLVSAGALLLVNLADVMLGVFARVHRPPMWTTDLAKITLVWMVMLAAAPALKRGEHMAIHILVARLPRTSRRVVENARRVIFICVLLAMIVLGFQYAYKLRMLTIMTMGIKKAVPLLAVPVGMTLMLVEYALSQFIPLDGDGGQSHEDPAGGAS